MIGGRGLGKGIQDPRKKNNETGEEAGILAAEVHESWTASDVPRSWWKSRMPRTGRERTGDSWFGLRAQPGAGSRPGIV